MILGGRNVESPYFGYGHQLGRRDYVDLDLLVEGAAAGKARAYFLEVWDSRHAEPGAARAPPDTVAQAAEELDRHAEWLERWVRASLADRGGLTPGSRAALAAIADRVEVGEVRFLHDPPAGKGESPGVGTGLLRLLEGAKESVVVESAYPIPTHELRRGLVAALERGVSVRILTNSLATTDNLWAQAGSVGARRRLVRMGVELWEYEGPQSIHTKAGVVDGRTVAVASFNLDPRSARLNREVAAVLESETLARRLRTLLDGHLARAHRIDRRGRPEGADGPFPGVPATKVHRLRQLLTPLIRVRSSRPVRRPRRRRRGAGAGPVPRRADRRSARCRRPRPGCPGPRLRPPAARAGATPW